jgi:hypothetical protein
VILAFLRLQADYAPGAPSTAKRLTLPMRQVVATPAAKDCTTRSPDRPRRNPRSAVLRLSIAVQNVPCGHTGTAHFAGRPTTIIAGRKGE